jgi:hypothetical protein
VLSLSGRRHAQETDPELQANVDGLAEILSKDIVNKPLILDTIVVWCVPFWPEAMAHWKGDARICARFPQTSLPLGALAGFETESGNEYGVSIEDVALTILSAILIHFDQKKKKK